MGAGESTTDETPPPTSVFWLARTSSQQEAVKLIWIKKFTAVYQSLSTNIIREVLEYMSGEKLLASLQRDKVLYFDCAQEFWRQDISLSEQIDVDKYTSVLLVGPYELFACGGGNSYHRAYFIRSGVVTGLSNMYTPRQFPALYYDASWDAVHVFGGSTGSKRHIEQSLAECEMYQRRPQRWAHMPAMKEPRRQFNACGHRELVYLCGGWASSVETFDLRRHEFRLEPLVTLPEAKWCLTVIQGNDVIVISENYVSRFNFRTAQKEREMRKVSYNPWSRCMPVIINNEVFALGQEPKLAKIIDVDTGEIKQKL